MNSPVQPPSVPTPPKSWMDRNWKWFVPVVSVGALIVFGAFAGGIFYFVERTLKNSEPYHVALERIRASPDVAAALGKPLHESWLVMGNYRVQNFSRYEDLTFTMAGPQGSARVYLVATANTDGWSYRVLTVNLEATHQQIDLADRKPD
ncbi:MAG TPA: cytochrome c oxidase assembly factor Coa1 family protein [Candidatus Didemnitutus sp.]